VSAIRPKRRGGLPFNPPPIGSGPLQCEEGYRGLTGRSVADFMVVLGEGVGLVGLAGLQHDLSDALGVRVDLVTKDALKPGIGQRILSEAVML
jgi:hypothetical protein